MLCLYLHKYIRGWGAAIPVPYLEYTDESHTSTYPLKWL